VQLTVILDTCHSGTGTRLLLAPDPDGTQQPVRVGATIKRTVSSFGTGARELELAAAAALNPDHAEVVRVRYVEPPQAVKDAIAIARTKAHLQSREIVRWSWSDQSAHPDRR